MARVYERVMDYEKIFNEYAELITDDYVIVNAEKHLVKNINSDEVESLSVSQMLKEVRAEKAKYYNDEYDVYALYYTNRKQWQEDVDNLQAFIDKYGKPAKETPDKYKLTCSICGESWNYKRKNRVIKEYKSCNCPICRKKSLVLSVL